MFITRIKPALAFIYSKLFQNAIVGFAKSRMAPAFLRLMHQTTGMGFVNCF
jgi:hypothetical protein